MSKEILKTGVYMWFSYMYKNEDQKYVEGHM